MISRKTASTIGLFIATMSWGASFFLVKAAVVRVGVWPYLSYRLAVATILIAVIFPKKFFKPSRGVFSRGAVLGFLLFLAIWTQTTGLQMTTASRSGFLTALYVPFTPFLGWLLFRQKIFFKQIAVALTAVGGLYVLTNPGDLTAGLVQWWKTVNPGDLWTIATAIVSALHIIVTEKYTRQESDSVALGLWQFAWCAVWVFLTASVNAFHGMGTGVGQSPGLEAPLTWNILKWPTIALVSVGFNSAFSTCFAFIMQIVAQKSIGSLKAALIFAMEAPLSSCFAFVFTGEVMTFRELTGAAIVFLTSIIPEAWLKTSERRV